LGDPYCQQRPKRFSPKISHRGERKDNGPNDHDFFSEVFKRAIPIRGLISKAEILNPPIIIPIAAFIDPSLDR
jgi:hypothetical protein